MPRKSMTEAWVRDLTWAQAVNAYLREKPERADKPLPKQITYMDRLERGLTLVLVLGAGGTKAWRVLTYENGKAVSHKIKDGTYPKMSFKEAKDKAEERFENPEKIKAQEEVGTFKKVADAWYKHHVERNNLRSKKDLKRHLDNYILPKWKSVQFHDIGRRKVAELLDDIADNNGPAMADAILATIRSIMTWQEARDDHYRSPIARKMRRKKATARARVLTYDEIKTVWTAAGDCGTFGALVKMLLLTAQRRDKVAKMKHADISAEGVWTIPSEEREKGNAGLLKLPQAALDIIAAQPQLAKNPFVFAGTHGRALNSFSQGTEDLRKLLPENMPRWTLHDLRRTARTLMSDAGVRPDVAERVLGHAIPGVGGVYDRSEYFEQKADALQKLAALVERILNPPAGSNVIALDQRTAREPITNL